jgi:hypothetical protein
MNKKWLIIISLATLVTITGCNKEKEPVVTPTIEGETGDVVTDNNQKEEVTKEARDLFHNLINIGSDKSESEMKKIVEENVYDPAEYIKTLVDNNLSIEYGNYTKATAAHREEVLKKVGSNHYIYESYVGIDLQESKDSKAVTGYAQVTMELKKRNGSLKVLKLDLKPSGE